MKQNTIEQLPLVLIIQFKVTVCVKKKKKKKPYNNAELYISFLFSSLFLLLSYFFPLTQEMTRRKSMQNLVNPLRKLSFLSSTNLNNTFRPDLEFVPEQQDVQEDVIHNQNDILTLFPREVILKILSLLSFQDLIKIQLVRSFFFFFCR